MFKKFDKWKLVLVVIGAVLLAGYLGGFLYILFGDANVDLTLFTVWLQDGPAPGAGCGSCSLFWCFSFLRHL